MLVAKLISHKVNQRYSELDSSSVAFSVISYIQQKSKLREPQHEAIKTYLWIKFECSNLPISEAIALGKLSHADTLKDFDITDGLGSHINDFLYIFSQENGLDELAEDILKNRDSDRKDILSALLHDYGYSNFLYSLPMGAGKTYLMACFIYLDLYFAELYSDDNRFAHNFVVLAPHSSKTAILPSLKTIAEFDPGWILPREDAIRLKGIVTFEVLDALSSKRKDKLHGNNPNLEKVNRLTNTQCFGLVFITNAEKVVLEKYSKTDQQYMEMMSMFGENKALTLFDYKNLDEIQKTNELREKLSEMRNIGIILDEVHHSYGKTNNDEEKKLRAVVSVLNQHNHVTNVLGLSGTPYVKHKVDLGSHGTIKLNQIQDIVYNYDLSEGIGVFLKEPDIFGEQDVKSEHFVTKALDTFFANYDKTYSNGTASKVAFYCPSRKVLNDEILPVIEKWYQKKGRDIREIFKYYTNVSGKKETDKKYNIPNPAEAKALFENLDKAYNNHVRIVLLIAIGTEGWNCKSLTGVVLPRKETTTNFVLQTTCRCLREVDDASQENAMIYLIKENYDILEKQLNDNYRLSISSLKKQSAHEVPVKVRKPNLGKLQYKQVQKKYIVATEKHGDLKDFNFEDFKKQYTYTSRTDVASIDKKGLRVKETKYSNQNDVGELFTYSDLVYGLVDALYGRKIYHDIVAEHGELLQKIYSSIEKEKKWLLGHPDSDLMDKLIHEIASYFSTSYNYSIEVFSHDTEIELFQREGENNTLSVNDDNYNKLFIPELYKKKNRYKFDENDVEDIDPYDKSFSYAPYKTDSVLEVNFLQHLLTNKELLEGIELHYNGYSNQNLQSFYIQTDVGRYTPDFLFLKRNEATIEKMIIIETKGGAYYDDSFKQKEKFVREVFLKENPHIHFAKVLVDYEGRNNVEQFISDVTEAIQTHLN